MEERRTIEELVSRYALEPSIRDVYVEGSLDQLLVEWFLNESEITDVTTYSIDSVDVPNSILDHLSLDHGNRGRIIALAHKLEETSPSDLTKRVACIADADFNHVHGKSFPYRLLVFTDYTSIELYCYDEQVLSKFLQLVMGRFPVDAKSTLAQLEPVLRDLFLMRVAVKVLNLNLSDVPFEKCCSMSGSKLVFDLEEHVDRCLNKNARMSEKSRLLGRHPKPAIGRHLKTGHRG